MTRRSWLRLMAAGVLVVWLCLFLHWDNTEKSMIRALLVETSGDGWTAVSYTHLDVYKRQDFKIFWDEAYIVHHLTDEIIETPVLLNECKKYGTEDRVFMFTSTSKITFPGAGVSALAVSYTHLDVYKRQL